MNTFSHLRVLVVDDDDAFRTLLRRALAQLGCDVREAANGREALRVQLTFQPEIVFTDLLMPDIDGLEILAALRRLPSPPRVVAMSGGGRFQTGDLLAVAAQLGACATLPKPFDAPALLRAFTLAARPAPTPATPLAP